MQLSLPEVLNNLADEIAKHSNAGNDDEPHVRIPGLEEAINQLEQALGYVVLTSAQADRLIKAIIDSTTDTDMDQFNSTATGTDDSFEVSLSCELESVLNLSLDEQHAGPPHRSDSHQASAFVHEVDTSFDSSRENADQTEETGGDRLGTEAASATTNDAPDDPLTYAEITPPARRPITEFPYRIDTLHPNLPDSNVPIPDVYDRMTTYRHVPYHSPPRGDYARIYVVWSGTGIGVFLSYEEVQQRVSRVSNARFQRAQDWLDGHMKMRKAIDEGFYVL